MATQHPVYTLYACDDSDAPGTWGDALPDPTNDTDSLLGGPDGPPGVTLPNAPSNTDWRVIRLVHREGISQLFRCEVTLAAYRPLVPEDQYSTYDDPNTIWDDASKGPAALAAAFGPGGSANNESFGQYVLGDMRSLDPDWAISAPISPAQFIGRRLSVAINHTLEDGTNTGRWISGVVTEFEDLGNECSPNYRIVNVVIEPTLWKLSMRKNCRVFQKHTAIEIITSILDEADIYKDDRRVFQPANGSQDTWTPRREYTVQYNETDLDFISRLLEEEGISYCFDHRKLTDGIVFLDQFPLQTNNPADVAITPRAQVGTQGGEVAWDVLQQNYVVTKLSSSRDFSYFANPLVPFEDPEGSPNTDTTIDEDYEYPAREPLATQPGADGLGDVYVRDTSTMPFTRAKVRQQALDIRAVTAKGKGTVMGTYAGGTIAFATSSDPSIAPVQAQTYLVTQVQHLGYPRVGDIPDIASKLPAELTQDDHIVDEAADVKEYFNRYTCVVAPDNTSTFYRPLRLTPKPVVAGLQPAVVLSDQHENMQEAAPDDKIPTEHIGRVKIRFLWDRRGGDPAPKTNDPELPPLSAWVRVVQPWAGFGYGVQFFPRYGMEVGVLFEDGDPDRPVIVGTLYDALHHSFLNQLNADPDHTVGKDTFGGNTSRLGFRTRSHPDASGGTNPNPAGFNEFTFDDVAQNERVYVHAEHDLSEDVGHRYQSDVLGSQSFTVTGTQSETFEGKQDLFVFGERRRIEVTKKETDTVAKTRTTTVYGGMDLTNVHVFRSTKLAGFDVETIGTKDKNPQSPADPDKLAKAITALDEAKKKFDDAHDTFKSKNDEYAEWLTKLKNGDSFLHAIAADIGIAEKPIDHVRELAAQVNVGSDPRAVTLQGDAYKAAATDGKYGNLKFCEDPTVGAGQGGDFKSINSDTDATKCGDGDLAKNLRQLFKDYDQAKSDLELQQSLVRNIKTKGGVITEIDLTDTLTIDGERQEKVGGAVKLQAKGVSMSSTGMPNPDGSKPPDSTPKTVIQMGPKDTDSPSSDPAGKDLPKPNPPGIVMKATGGNPPSDPAKLEILGHEPASDHAQEVSITAKSNLTVEAPKGGIVFHTPKTTSITFDDQYVTIKSQGSVTLMATDKDNNRGYILLQTGMFVIGFNDDNNSQGEP